MVRNNIVLVKRDRPVRVTLPNGRTFLAKYRRVSRNYLPEGTTIARTYIEVNQSKAEDQQEEGVRQPEPNLKLRLDHLAL